LRISIPCLYAEYGRYINQFRAIPGNVDCLKPVERRILMAMHTMARTKFTKCAKVVGAALAVHPHGDMSTYGTMVALINRGFIIGKGNFGGQNYEEDSKAAAYRYPECKASPHIEDMAFKYIKHVPWAVLENENEPLHLPCPVPLGLLSSGEFSTITQGISFETTKMPRYQFIDLITRLHEILTTGKGATIIKPHCYGNTVAEDTPGQFESLLTTGIGKIWYCPNYKIGHKYIDILDARNPETGFSKLKKLHIEYPKNIAVEDLSAKGQMRIRVHCKLGSVTTTFINTIVGAVSARVNFKCNVVNNQGQVETHSIDDLLLNSYNAWVEAWRGNLEAKLEGMKSRLHHLEIIQVIRDCYQPQHTTVQDIINEFNKNKTFYNNRGIYECDISETASKGSIKQLIETQLNTASVKREINDIEGSIKVLDKTAVDYIGGLIT